MSYFKIEMVDKQLTIYCIDSAGLNNDILEEIKQLGLDTSSLSNNNKTQLYDTILETILLMEIKDSVKLVTNRAYIVKFNIDKIAYNYNIAYIDNDKVDLGYAISKTIL